MLAPANWPDLLEPGLREVFTSAAFGRPTPVMERLFGPRDSGKYQESYLSGGAFGLVPRFEGSVEYDDLSQGWKTVITNPEFAKGIYVKRAWVDDEQYGMISQMTAALGDTFGVTREVDAADIFNSAFTSGTYRTGDSNLGGDGVVLASASHPRSPKDATTQSNFSAYALSLDNWDTVRQNGGALTDDRGNMVGVNYDTILVPRELERTARQIFDPRAMWEPGSAEFTVNMFAGTTTIIVWDYLTDANAWFALDSRLMKRHLIWQNRVPLEFAREGDFDGIGQKFRGYVRYGRGFSDWRWVYGANPA